VSDDDQCGGPPIPAYVSQRDRARWRNAAIVAANMLGLPPTDGAVWQATRTIFHDRTSYPD
jgi:hypothetical protein